MSIPLVQEATKDAINTSIIAIKRNIERINMLLGLSNSEEIDTSKFATKDELQQAVTDLQPVDEVALNNMQSVSSNAVAEQLEVSELKTLVDNGNWLIKYRTMGKLIIFTIHAKVQGNISAMFPDFRTVTTGEGLKTALTWGGMLIGEAFVSPNGSGINASVRYSGEGGYNGSGELVTFLA